MKQVRFLRRQPWSQRTCASSTRAARRKRAPALALPPSAIDSPRRRRWRSARSTAGARRFLRYCLRPPPLINGESVARKRRMRPSRLSLAPTRRVRARESARRIVKASIALNAFAMHVNILL
ncbi:hypothetical protein EVAR_85365_1 [Eumeta japonica]|uniref:Uncharacterized protein n=1 Tax=Eumeta variegata TaxID=151549 RepID=A0A4C1WTX4_EUMVA|nr:hypothetical protein EVAR_85365_1 [Eumeta japonica]